MLMGIVIVTPADTTRRVPGYGGVLSLPILAPGDTISLNARLDQILERRDTRAERGRVIYAAGHAPARQAPAATPSRSARVKSACPQAAPGSDRISKPLQPPPPQQTVVQDKTPTSPNS
jgi:hypothetical protein